MARAARAVRAARQARKERGVKGERVAVPFCARRTSRGTDRATGPPKPQMAMRFK